VSTMVHLEANERIYRYEVPVDDQWHGFALLGDPLHVGCRRPDVVEFWARWSLNGTAVFREFRVVGTGHPLPEDVSRYHGTVPIGALVWHLVERHPSNVPVAP
jgi:hypothetical protein